MSSLFYFVHSQVSGPKEFVDSSVCLKELRLFGCERPPQAPDPMLCQSLMMMVMVMIMIMMVMRVTQST